jgi:hypothetical protein
MTDPGYGQLVADLHARRVNSIAYNAKAYILYLDYAAQLINSGQNKENHLAQAPKDDIVSSGDLV